MKRWGMDNRGEGPAGYLIALMVASALLIPVLWQLLGAVRDLAQRFIEAIQ